MVLNAAGTYHLGEHDNINVDFTSFVGAYENAIERTNRVLVGIKPYYSFYNPESRVTTNLGLNVVYENDSLFGGSNVHVYPFAQVDVILSRPPEFKIYAGIDGDIEQNKYNTLFSQNPALSRNAVIAHSNRQIRIFGGVKATVLKEFTFDAGASYNNYDNLNFFLNDVADQSVFNIVYDTATTTLFKLHTEAFYSKGKYLKLGGRFEYNNYSTGSINEAFHRPTYELSLLSTYTVNNRLKIGGDFVLLGGIKALDNQGAEVTLDPIVDLSLRADYKINTEFSAWVDINNIFSNQYERYLYYPTKDINFLLGLTYKLY